MAQRRIFRIMLLGLLANLVLFSVYRISFLTRFGEDAPRGEMFQAVLFGLRLDFALLAFELALFGVSALVRRRVTARAALLWWTVLSSLHAVLCMSNYFTFAERNQNAGELLLPYITSPYQVYLAVMPFLQAHWLVTIVVLAVAVIAICFAWCLGRKFGAEAADVWKTKSALALLICCVLSPALFAIQPVIAKKVEKTGARQSGWKLRITESKYYTRFTRYALNQGVMNPLFEFFRVQLPAHFRNSVQYHLTEAEAEELWLARGEVIDKRYPLLKKISGTPGSRIKNIIIIQVEGLTGSLLWQERSSRAVMPCLRRLAAQGLYFSNALQNANFTSGGVFSAATGVPKITYDDTEHRFTRYEMTGYYASLPRVLGNSNYAHFFFESFRQSSDDFLACMGNQGFQCHGYGDFKRTLQRKNKLSDGVDTLLGIADGEFLDESAEILLACKTPFTAYLMTCSTHSPWLPPSSFPRAFAEPELNSFAYLDASVEAFIAKLTNAPSVWQQMLLVILGDHTSVTFSSGRLERLRIPLIFYSPNLPVAPMQSADWASQVDVVPTALGLLGGEHLFAGFGNNLLDPRSKTDGIVSGTPDLGFYWTPNCFVEYRPAADEMKFFAAENGVPNDNEMSTTHSEDLRRLRKEYFSRVELARRLGIARRIFPVRLDDLTPTQAVANPKPNQSPSSL